MQRQSLAYFQGLHRHHQILKLEAVLADIEVSVANDALQVVLQEMLCSLSSLIQRIHHLIFLSFHFLEN